MVNFKTMQRQIPVKQKNGKTLLMLTLLLTTMCNTPAVTNSNIVLNTDSEKTEQQKELAQAETAKPEPNLTNTELNPRLFGTWKTSEVLGDANGEMLASEAFMEFNEDGSFSAWAGRGAGVGASWDEDRKNATKGKWRYADKTLYLIDPVSGEESGVSIMIADNKFMLTVGNDRHVFVKVE